MEKKQIKKLMDDITALYTKIENVKLENMCEAYVLDKLDEFWYALNEGLGE